MCIKPKKILSHSSNVNSNALTFGYPKNVSSFHVLTYYLKSMILIVLIVDIANFLSGGSLFNLKKFLVEV